MSDARIRVIGIGHPDRGDDAAGLLVVRELAARLPAAVDVLECTGDQTRLLDAWRGATLVVVVDAMCTGLEPGTVHVLDPKAAPLLENPALSAHGFGLATAIELGQALGNLPERLVIIGIEGIDFATGALVSTEVRAAVRRAVDLLVETLAGDAAATCR
jgi:hydrogenase maturation protease